MNKNEVTTCRPMMIGNKIKFYKTEYPLDQVLNS